MKKIFSEFFYLCLVQSSNYLLPLLTFPYLIRVFGLGTFGEYVIIQTVVSYFLLLVDFGFNVTGVKQISQAVTDEDKSRIFNSILASKVILVLISFAFLIIAGPFVSQLKANFISYLVAFPIIIGQAFFPIWFYQAVQKMRVATIINVLIKLFFTVCIFLFVKNKTQINLALGINAVGFLIGGIISLVPIYTKYHLRFKLPELKHVLGELNESWKIFASRVFTNMYSSTNILILAYFRSPVVVGRYSAADKVFRGIYNICVPVIQVTFPVQARAYAHSVEKYKDISKKIFILIAGLCLLLGITVYIFSPLITKLVIGVPDKEVTLVLRIFTLSIILYPFGGLFTNMLAIQDMNSVLLRAVSFSALLNFILIVPVVYYFSIVGLAYLSFVTQLLIFFYKGIALVKNLNR